ncbi:MAG TPA: T9SS type A sorting domain-containing protein [Bacteroidetes bacterium]|nr:T9SS type A sorting domain-containing protein [Bacteroidota bacterium]
MKNILFTLSFLLFFFSVKGQSFNILDVPVFQNGAQMTNPWVGGMNAPQWSSFDINNDGRKDLYAFDRNGNVHISFINLGGSPGEINYKYSRHWLKNFPPIHHYVLMRDFNRDGVIDMFSSAFDEFLSGFKVFKGTYENGMLNFEQILFPEYDYDIIPLTSGGDIVGQIEVFNNADYPAIDDIDGDGDLDILTMSQAGDKVRYFKNIALERGYTDDTLIFELGHECFGRFGLTPFSQSLELSSDANMCAFFKNDEIEDKTVHGGTTLCTFDSDGDGDKEILYGDLISPNIIFAKNGGNPDMAWMTEQDTTFPSYNVPVSIPEFAATFFVDVDNDGARDLIASPNLPLFSPDVETAHYYKNIGTDQNPEFSFVQPDFLADNILDFGTGAQPAFTDVNGDGLIDIVVGNREEWAGGTGSSYLSLLLNNGTETEPSFEVVDRDWLGFSQYYPQSKGYAPAFGDIDGDGDEDMLVGDRFGSIHFLENIAGAGQPMDFGAVQLNWKGINVGQYATPFIHDMNGDGLGDLLIGERSGSVNYFPNIGSAGNPEFNPNEEESPNNEFFGKINTQLPGSVLGYSQPAVLDLGGEKYIATGSWQGWLRYYKVDPDSLDSGSFELLDARLGNLREGAITRVAFANINGSDFMDAVVGNDRGGLTLFQSPITIDGLVNDGEILEIKKPASIDIYPNPAKGFINIKLEGFNRSRELSYSIYNSIGQQAMKGVLNEGLYIDVNNLPKGIYFIKIKSGKAGYAGRFYKN